jgi:phenylacetate-CoA ligase
MSFRGLVSDAVFRPWYALRGRRYYEHLHFLEQSQWWGAEQIRDFQWAELKKLLKTAFDSVPYYRQKYAGVRYDDIRGWDDFARLPILTREEIRTHREELRSTAYAGQPHPHATGGSSGEPVRFYRTIESYDWRTAAKTRTYGWSGLREGVSSLHLWGGPVGTPPWSARLKGNIDHWIRNERVISTFLQSAVLWRKIHEEALRRKPEYLVGYVSSLVRFARFLEAENLQRPRFQAAVAAAEPLTDTQRSYIEGVLDTPVFNTYGSREFMSIAGECENHRMHIAAENLVVEADGGDGSSVASILVSDLHNHATVFLRYSIGDLGRLSSGTCSCGRGLPLLETIVGRQNEVLRLADGRELNALFFPHTLKEVPEILEYQVVQVSLQNILLKLVTKPGLSEQGRSLIDRELRKVLGSTSYSIELVKEIEKSRSGKQPFVVSLLNQPGTSV